MGRTLGSQTKARVRARFHQGVLLSSTGVVALTMMMCQAHAQDAGSTVLETITVVGGENARGPDQGIVAKRSRGASKTDTSIRETPQAVSVVTRDQMDAQGVDTVAQALRYTPGVLSDPSGYDIRYDWLQVRGFNSYGTMWLDGLLLPGDPLNYATPTVNPFALERVEVIKGPASVLYGSAIPGGLVNQVSKRPQATASNEAGVQTSSHGGVQATIDMTGPLTEDDEWLYRIVALGKNMGTQVDREREKQLMLAPSLTWAPTDQTSLTFFGYYQKDRPNFSPRFYPAVGTLLDAPFGKIPRDLYLGDPNADTFERDFYMLGYEFEHEFNEIWTVRQNLRYGRSDQNMFLALVNPAWGAWQPDGHTLNRVSAASDDRLSNFNVDTQAEARFDTGAFDHTMLFGLDYLKASSSRKFGNGGGVPPLDVLDPRYGEVDIPMPAFTRSALQEQQQVGLYIQDQIRYDNWLGTFGLRYDASDIDTTDRMAGTPAVSNSDQKLTWRAGLTYLFDNGIAPYASYSTSFLPALGTDAAGNPFEAQTAQQYEIGFKYEPPEGRGTIGVSLFDMTLQNALTWDNSVFTYAQVGEQRVRGVEIEGKYELTPQLDILASYAYSNSKITESSDPVELGREMLFLPEHQASVWLAYRPDIVEGLTLSAGVRGMSSYQTDFAYLPQLRIPGRALVDIGAEFDFGAVNKEFSGTKLQVNVTNLFDKEYVSHCVNDTGGGCNYGAGRAITASLKYSW
ncbi:TonB-dependent siderophore receptor [Pararhizobium sp. O133]|uniref:TonB-dependent siderophore receptor n=1 Tax=Pararhizobium sp. O133 TaxID=3449278 RepID=UPI003F682DCB